VLRAAINHHADQGFHRALVKIDLPDKGAPRDRWLTRSEAARLLWTCWRYREKQTIHRGIANGGRGRDQATTPAPSRPVHPHRPLYGHACGGHRISRPTRGDGRSFVDLERGIF
jgi:hypothetical protein